MTDIKRLSAIYFASEPTKAKHTAKDEFALFVEKRFYNMAWSRNQWYNRMMRTGKLWDVFKPWLVDGENFNKAVRFPTLRDTAKAIKDEIMRTPPKAVLEPLYGEKANRAQALEAKVNEIKDNVYEKRTQSDCIADMLFYGRGVRMVNYYCEKKPDGGYLYDDVGTERLDPRNCYFDEKGRYLWDPKKRDMKRDAVFKFVYPYSTFLEKFQDMEGVVNLESVSAKEVEFSSDLNYETDREAEETKEKGLGVAVYSYYNQEENIMGIVANGVTIMQPKPIDNPLGRIPVVIYDFETRRDGAWPNSLAELIAPHIHAQDTIFNLEIMGLKLDLMPATMIDSDLGYNKKIHRLYPRAVWEMNVPPGKQLQNMVYPFQRAQSDPNRFYGMNNYIESQMTITSGQDRKALYLNPGELATQTAFKNQTMQKSVGALIFANELEAEAQMTELMVEFIRVYMTEKRDVKLGGKETKKYRKVKIKNFKTEQFNDGDVNFEPSQGVDSYFELTKDSVDVDVKVEVRDMRSKMMLQEKKVAAMTQFLPIATNFITAGASVDPAVLKKLDFVGMLEQTAEALDMDLARTIRNMDNSSLNIIEREHTAMIFGLDVPVPKDEGYEDSLDHKKQHERFRFVWRNNKKTSDETAIFKSLNDLQKRKFMDHYIATIENVKNKVLSEAYVEKEDQAAPPVASPQIQPVPAMQGSKAPIGEQTPGAGRNLLPAL